MLSLNRKFLIIILIFATFSFTISIKAMKEAEKLWQEEKPKYPNDNAERDTLAEQKNELEAQIKKEQSKENKSKQEEDELALDEKKLDYYNQVINQFDFSEQYHESGNLEDRKKEDTAIEQQKTLDKEITAAIAEQIQSGFNPRNGGNSDTSIISKVVESLQKNILQPIKNAIDKYVTVNRGRLSPKEVSTSVEKSIKKSVTIGGGTDISPQLPPSLKPKAVADQLNLWITAYNRPENVNVQKLYKDYISKYITKLENADIDYTLQHQKDPQAVKGQHDSIVAALQAIGIDQGQIDILNNYKDNAVKKIIEGLSAPEIKNQITQFFNPQSSLGEFTISAYQKLADETDKLNPTKTADHTTMINNVKQLQTTVDSLNDYTKYSLDALDLKTQTQLLEFLDAQQVFLANSYEDILNSPLTIDKNQINTLTSNLKKIEEDLKATEKRFITVAEQNLIKDAKRLQVQKLQDENKGTKILNDAFIKLGSETIPTSVSEFTQLLRDNNPLDSQTITKFDALTRGVEGFVKNMTDADPSKKGLLAAEFTLNAINELQDSIQIYNDTSTLSSAEQKQLVQYYKSLDELYTKVATQGIEDMNNLLKKLNDGTVIYLEQAKRTAPEEQFVRPLTKTETADFIEARFKAGRLDMTTSEDVSGG